jgi:hypothetical protein
MEAVALTLGADEGWRHLGGTPEKDPVEVIVRSFDRPVLFATGRGPARPDAEPVTVEPQSGKRLTGFHFFVRPAPPGGACRILVRGL